jgi:hypothetical protein
MYVRRVTERVQVTSRTYATRRLATARLARRARFQVSKSPATDVTGILEVGRVTRTTSRARQIRDPCANVSDVVRREEGS